MIDKPLIVMCYAESLGLIMHCETCFVCVALWDPDLKKWTDDMDGLDRIILGEEATCWADCNTKVKLPTPEQVAEFERMPR